MKILKSIMLIIGIALGILLIPNTPIFDESLTPSINQQLSQLPTPPKESNAVIYLYGLPAANNKNLKQAGETFIQILSKRKTEENPAPLGEAELHKLYKGSNLDKSWLNHYDDHCNIREDANCFGKLLAILSVSPIRDARLQAQLKRYQIIVTQTHFVEFTQLMDANSPLPDFYQMWVLGRLTTAQAYLTNNLDDFIAATQVDMRFWRMGLKQSQTLIGKMVSIAALQRNLLNLSSVLQKVPHLTQAQVQTLTDLLQPLSAEEWHIDEAYRGDLRIAVDNRDMFFNDFTNEGKIHGWLLRLMEQPTATANLFFQQVYTPLYKLSLLNAHEFYLSTQQPLNAPKFSPLNPYNLGGKIQLASPWPLVDYIGRTHDLEGLYSLVNLQLQMTTQSPDSISTLVHSSDFRNPYTQQPFDLDTNNRQISFHCFNASNRCSINY